MARSPNFRPDKSRNRRAGNPHRGNPPVGQGKLEYLPIGDLVPDPDNPRKHNRAQRRAIAKSIKAFGFNAPILIDRNQKIIAGHGRYEAAMDLGLTQVPVIRLEHLSEAQARAYMLADNKLTDRSTWDETKLAIHLKNLSDLALDFDIEDIGFELPEVDFRIQSLDAPEVGDEADEFEDAKGPAVSIAGDLETTVNNSVYFNNSEFNQLVTEMMQMPLGEERTKKDLRVQQLAAEEVPWIFLVEPGWREALKKEWTNFHWYPDNNPHLEWLYKS
jgi:hypothetical protein